MIPRTDNRIVYQYTNMSEIKYFQLYNNYFPKTYDIAFGGDTEGQSRRRKSQSGKLMPSKSIYSYARFREYPNVIRIHP